MKKIMKKILYVIFGSAYEAVLKRFNYLVTKFKNGYYGYNNLDKKLEKYVNYDNGFFVELGANDGVTQSNSLYFEMKRGWNGVLIEPSPNKYFACRENRSKKNNFFCNACVSFQYKEKYVDMKYADLSTISSNLELDIFNKDEHIGDAIQHLDKGESVINFGATAKTLNDILFESKAPKIIDFMSLDVEGAELEVLKGIDFEKYNFKYILIEVRNFDRINNFLNEYNYSHVEKFSGFNHLFKFN